MNNLPLLPEPFIGFEYHAPTPIIDKVIQDNAELETMLSEIAKKNRLI